MLVPRRGHEGYAELGGREVATHFSWGYSQFVREWIAGSSGCEIVAMMEAAKPRHRNDPATWAHSLSDRTPFRSLFSQREMRPVLVVVADVLGHQPFEMPLVEHDDMIEQVSAATADEAFWRVAHIFAHLL